MEPFIKAVGGKRWLVDPDNKETPNLADEITAIDPSLYVEPFVGGGAVALALSPSLPKIVADMNPAIVAVWRGLRMHKAEAIMAELARVYRAYPDTAFGYVKAREELNTFLVDGHVLPELLVASEPPPLSFVALAIYINARCFNGLWRVNRDGLMNTPWGKYQNPRKLTLVELRQYQAALVNTTETYADFRQVLGRLRKRPRAQRTKIAIFADPPYAGAFAGYTPEGFDDVDQRDLARWLRYCADLGMHVWTTNSNTSLIRELYSWGRIEEVSEYHSVGAKGNRRGSRSCLLIRSY